MSTVGRPACRPAQVVDRGDPMAIPKYAVVVVRLPDEIDMINSDDVYNQLCSAMAPGIEIVVADLKLTTFCDAGGSRALSHARDHATEAGVEIRFVIPPGNVLRVLEMLFVDQVLQPYPSLGAALDGGRADRTS
jgi:anti-anti-sigma factor